MFSNTFSTVSSVRASDHTRILMTSSIKNIYIPRKMIAFVIPIALYSGFPVNLSQMTIVSRWFVMPIARISVLLYLIDVRLVNFSIACSTQLLTASKISNGFCSTHRSCGWISFISISCEQTSSKYGSVLKIYKRRV